MAGDVWIWEYGAWNGKTVYLAEEWDDLEELKAMVAKCFSEFEEVERRGIRGTAILPRQYGRFVDTGHWIYRKPVVLDESRYPPSGCTFCGLAEQGHGRQWHDPAGWHAWTAPTDSQIRIRMINRRRAARALKEGTP